jgi:O-antigen/teichoic acid export membrane protein
MSHTTRLLSNTLFNSVAQFAQVGVAFVFMPLLVAHFGLTQYGLYLLALSFTGYLGLLDFGVGTAITKLVAEKRAKTGIASISDLISVGLAYYCVIGVASCGVFLLLARFSGAIFHLDPDDARLLADLLIVGAIGALVTWPLTTFAAVLAGLQRYDLTARVGLLTTALGAVAMAAVLTLDMSLVVLVVCLNIASIVGGLVAAVLLRRHAPGARIGFRNVSRATLRRVFGFSWVIFVTQICGVLSYQQTDRIILGVFAGPASVSLYEASSKFRTLVRMLCVVASTAAMPAASGFMAGNATDSLRTLFLRGSKYVDAFVLPFVVTIVALAGPLLRLWLGPAYASQTLAVQLFVGYYLLAANTTVAGAILTGTGRLRFFLWVSVPGSLLNVSLGVILTPSMGVLGVIWASVVTSVVVFPVYLWYVLRVVRVPLRGWLRQVVLPTYPLLLAPLVICLLAQRMGMVDSLLELVVVAGAAVFAYWALFLWLGMRRPERKGLIVGTRLALSRGGRDDDAGVA